MVLKKQEGLFKKKKKHIYRVNLPYDIYLYTAADETRREKTKRCNTSNEKKNQKERKEGRLRCPYWMNITHTHHTVQKTTQRGTPRDNLLIN